MSAGPLNPPNFEKFYQMSAGPLNPPNFEKFYQMSAGSHFSRDPKEVQPAERNEKSSSFFFAPKMEKIDVLKDEINSHWKWVIGGIILVVVIVLWINREKFGIGAPLIENPLPFTSGASLRVQSEDSATNRGFNDTWA